MSILLWFYIAWEFKIRNAIEGISRVRPGDKKGYSEVLKILKGAESLSGVEERLSLRLNLYEGKDNNFNALPWDALKDSLYKVMVRTATVVGSVKDVLTEGLRGVMEDAFSVSVLVHLRKDRGDLLCQQFFSLCSSSVTAVNAATGANKSRTSWSVFCIILAVAWMKWVLKPAWE